MRPPPEDEASAKPHKIVTGAEAHDRGQEAGAECDEEETVLGLARTTAPSLENFTSFNVECVLKNVKHAALTPSLTSARHLTSSASLPSIRVGRQYAISYAHAQYHRERHQSRSRQQASM